MKIKEWSADERPREKVMAYGVESVSNAELLAILIGGGTPGESSVDLMRRVLHDNGDTLRGLGAITQEELEDYNGIGPAKAITILAAMELGKRLMREPKNSRETLDNPAEMYQFMHSVMYDLQYEECHVMMLDAKRHLLGHKLVSRGGITESTVDTRMVLRHALLAGATSIVLFHNHPSGNPQPSAADDHLTETLQYASRALNIRLMDHIIIGSDTYFSYYEHGKL